MRRVLPLFPVFLALALPVAAAEDSSDPYLTDPALEFQDQCTLQAAILGAPEGSEQRTSLETLWAAVWPETSLPGGGGGEVLLCGDVFSPPPGEATDIPNPVAQQYCMQFCGRAASRVQDACNRRISPQYIDCGGVGFFFYLECAAGCFVEF